MGSEFSPVASLRTAVSNTASDCIDMEHGASPGTHSDIAKSPPEEKSVPFAAADDEFPDGGFDAWMVVVADFWCCFNTWGFTNSFGVFQTYYLANQLSDSTPSDVAWIGSVQTFLLFAPSVVVGRLTDAGYVRPMIIFGTLIQVFALMMTSISTEYYQIFLSQGLAFGLGLCPLFLTAVAVVPHWFKRRRALALGIGAAGSSVGGVIYPITLNKLFPMIGFAWTVRVCGLIMLVTQSAAIIYLKPRLQPRSLRGAAFFDPASFKQFIYILVTAGLFLSFAGLYTPFVFSQDFAIYHGIDTGLAFYTLPIINAASTLGRIVPSESLSPGALVFFSLYTNAFQTFMPTRLGVST